MFVGRTISFVENTDFSSQNGFPNIQRFASFRKKKQKQKTKLLRNVFELSQLIFFACLRLTWNVDLIYHMYRENYLDENWQSALLTTFLIKLPLYFESS